MKLEVEAIASLVPSVRAEIARELAHNYNLNQQQISELLGVSQPAVSQYLRRMRGSVYHDDFVRKEVKFICGKILGGEKEY